MQRIASRTSRNVVMLALVGLLLTITTLLFAPLQKPWPKVLEGMLYLHCFLLLVNYPPVQQLFASIPQGQRRAVLCLGGVLLFTQLYNRPQQTFPFIPWNMYSGRFAEPIHYQEYVGIDADHHEVVIPIEKLFASQARTIYWRLQDLLKKMGDEHDQSNREKYEGQQRALLNACILRFNELHPDQAVTRVRIFQCTMSRSAIGDNLQVTRRLLKEFPLS
jgi:hypothetical protein